MAVPAAQRRLLQDILGKDLSEGHDHRGFSTECSQLGFAIIISSDPFRGEHREAEFFRPRFHRRWNQLFASTAPTIRLRDDPNDGVTRIMQCIKGWHRIARCPPEQNLQRQASPVMESPSTQT